MTKDLTAKQVAEKTGISIRRVQAKFKQGHYPHARFCECGHALLIPEKDLGIKPVDRRKKSK